MESELKKLERENHDLKEQLRIYIPRRRVRRVYKLLKGILEADIKDDSKRQLEILKTFINKIEKESKAEAGQDIKTAIEYLLSIADTTKEVDE